MGKSKKNASSARAVPPSKQNPVGSFDRSSSPSSEEYEKVENVENVANSDDISNWSKVGSAADSGTDNDNSSNNSQQPSTSSSAAPLVNTTQSKNEQPLSSSDSETDQTQDDNDKKRTVSSKERQPNVSKNDSDNEETLIYERITELRDGAPKTRKELYQRSYAIFSKIEQLNNKKKETSLSSSYSISSSRKSNIAKCVNEYTSLLFQYFEYLNQNGGDKEEKAHASNLLRIWDLCERLNFSGNANDAVVTDMMDWLNLHWPSEETSTQDLQRFGSFDSDDEELVIVDHDDISNGDDDQEESEAKAAVDWLLIRRNLLRGNVTEAIQMLKACLSALSADNQGCLKRVIQIAETMPTLPQQQDNTSSLAAWQAWAEHRLQVLDEFEGFSSSIASPQDIPLSDRRVRKEINLLLKILCGDEKVISKAGTFLESFVGSLIYCEPFRTRTDTAAVVERLFFCSSFFPTSDDQQQHDVVVAACQSILLRDWDGALSVFDDYYLQTHIGHAFICAGIMNKGYEPAPSMDHEACINPVYHIMNAYAKSIAHEENMWDEAMGYISACSTNRDYWAKELLNDRIESAKSIDDLKQMVRICDDYQFLELRKLLCKVMAEKYEQEGNIQEATINYAMAGDVVSLDRLADKALQQYLESGILEQVVVTETDETRVTLEKSTHYKFLHQYHRLRNLLEKSQHGEAADLIKQMLTSINAPAEFQVILLIDSMSILEETTNNHVIFNESETLDLMRRLQHMRNNLHENVFTQCYNRVRSSSPSSAGAADSSLSITNDNDVVSKISQSLAFNLANALVAQ